MYYTVEKGHIGLAGLLPGMLANCDLHCADHGA